MFTFIDVMVFCFVSGALIKYYDQKQEFILTYSSEEGVRNAQEGMGAGTKAGLASHISSAYRRTRVQVASVSINSPSTPRDRLAPEPPQTMGPQTSCRPSIQKHNHMGNF